MKIKAWFLERFRRRPQVSVEVDERGVHCRDGETIFRTMLWTEVEKIETFKLDLWTTDTICLRFLDEHEEVLLDIREETPGFGDVANRLTTYFPEIDADWITRVTVPAFETNHVVLNTREPGRGHTGDVSDETGRQP